MTAVAKDTTASGIGRGRRSWRLGRRTSRKQIVLSAIAVCRLERYNGQLTDAVKDLLDEARESVEEHGDVQAGWECLNAARRMQMLTATPERLRAESIALEEEAAKLSGWRAKAIHRLVKEARGFTEHEADKPDGLRTFLYMAREIRDEGLLNNYRKVAILREQLRRLGFILIGTVLGLLLMAMLFPVSLDGQPTTDSQPYLFISGEIPDATDGKVLVYMALFGALGGSLSAIQWVIKASSAASGLPERRLHGPRVYMRPFYGVAAAIAVFPFLLSGLLPVESNKNAVIFAIALVAGFTERFIASAVGSIAPEKDQGGSV